MWGGWAESRSASVRAGRAIERGFPAEKPRSGENPCLGFIGFLHAGLNSALAAWPAVDRIIIVSRPDPLLDSFFIPFLVLLLSLSFSVCPSLQLLDGLPVRPLIRPPKWTPALVQLADVLELPSFKGCVLAQDPLEQPHSPTRSLPLFSARYVRSFLLFSTTRQTIPRLSFLPLISPHVLTRSFGAMTLSLSLFLPFAREKQTTTPSPSTTQ